LPSSLLVMNNVNYLPIFELTRGSTVESVHYGSIAVVDASGNLLAWWGDPQLVTFLRSSAKPLQVLPFLEQGGQACYHLTLEEIALMCASHSGTDAHVRVARGIQAKTGVREVDLQCGVHPLTHQPTLEAMRMRGEALTPNRHNCSGKHTGMLAFARMRNLPTSDYLNPAHPIQQEILATLAEMCGLTVEQVVVGIDGCSAPNFALPLYNAALAYARLCDPGTGQVGPPARLEACRTVTQAMTAYPDMVGGPDSFDTRLMQAAQGQLVCKSGAEGYLALGLLQGVLAPNSPALGITIKISDGDLDGHNRPVGDPKGMVRPAVALEVLRQLGAITPSQLESVAGYGPIFQLKNWRQLTVGEGQPCFELERGG
jgi:L-asparaginase II